MDAKDTLVEIDDNRISNIIAYINHDIVQNNRANNSVVFFGGEPLLVPDAIEKIINKTKHLNLKYIMYTNGVLLNQTPLNLLKKLSIIFVSLDGDKTNHEKYRGGQTYDTIVQNLINIKDLGPHVIGRMTIEEDTDIYDSVINILPLVNSLHWQIVNKPKFNNIDMFLEKYKRGLTALCDFWISNLKSGDIKQIIPFQAITDSLLNSNKKLTGFRCGVINNHVVIDINGNLYYCDEQIGNKHSIIGNINSNKNKIGAIANCESIYSSCKNCDILNICRGRCWKCLTEYSQEQISNYCALTKIIVEVLSNNINTIQQLINNGMLNSSDIYKGPYYTEEIP